MKETIVIYNMKIGKSEYRFKLFSEKVKKINTKYRKIKTRIPHKNEVFNIHDLISIKIIKASERKILTIQIRKVDN